MRGPASRTRPRSPAVDCRGWESSQRTGDARKCSPSRKGVSRLDILLSHAGELLTGTAYTLVAAAGGVVLSVTFGAILGVIQALRLKGLGLLLILYIETIRNTPELIQLFWLYLVLPALGVNLSVNEAVLVYLTVNGTAYTAEIVRGAVLSIPRGQREAAQALGLGGYHLYRRIILPQALRKVQPALVNQMIMVLKNTTLVSFIAAPDIVYYANHLSSITLQAVPFQVYTGAMFFVVITAMAALAKRFERRGMFA